jgi:hypothetical protein
MYINRKQDNHYLHSTDFELGFNDETVTNNPEYDAKPDTLQFQIQLNSKYSPVYEYNKVTRTVRRISDTELQAILKYGEEFYQQRLEVQLPMAENILKEMFSLPDVMQGDGTALQQPLDTQYIGHNGKQLIQTLYMIPEAMRNSINGELYAQFVFDPQAKQVIEFTTLTNTKQVVRKITLEEDRVITDIDPATFFSKDYWVNEKQLTEGVPSFEDEQSATE